MSSRRSALFELTRARVLLFLREPEAVFWVFLFPVILAVVLGYAFSDSDVAPSRVAILPGAGADALAARLKDVEHLEIVRIDGEAEARKQLRSGGVDALMRAGDPPEFTFDAKRTEGETARLRVLRALDPRPPPELAEQRTEVRGARYIDFLFAGLLGMNLMGTGIWGVGFGVVDMRAKKLLKRFLVTPMRRSSFLLAFIFSRIIFLCMELVVLMVFGLWVLGVPLVGSALSLAVVALLGTFCFSGLGLLVAARPRTIEGVSGLMNFAMLPMWLLSGVFFSYERFPDWLHPVIRMLPLTALNDGLRSVMLDGATLASLLPEIAVLGGWCAVCFVLALKLFRWQ